MNYETTLDIILASIILVLHVVSLLISIIHRHKNFVKCLHQTGVGIIAYGMSLLSGVLFPVLALFGIFNGDNAITIFLITGICVCPIFLIISTTSLCYCVYIRGTTVIKQTLFSVKSIDISKPDVYIYYPIGFYEDGQIPSDYRYLEIYYFDKCVRFNSRTTEGDLASFVSLCKAIQKKKLVKKK